VDIALPLFGFLLSVIIAVVSWIGLSENCSLADIPEILKQIAGFFVGK
jgi:hypothetical protein